MEITTHTPDNGRLVTVQVQYTSANTTWFIEDAVEDVYSIADIDGNLLIHQGGYRIPLLIQGRQGRRSIMIMVRYGAYQPEYVTR
jgi:hypothetical protein